MIKEEVFILIDKNAGKSVNYIAVHKTLQRVKYHQHHRELKTKKNSTYIRKAYLIFEKDEQNR